MKLTNNKTTENNVLSHEILAQTIINNTTEIEGMRLASIPVSLLRICDKYQRPVDNAHVNELATPFDRIYANCLITSYRDGYFWILDGQHRYKAALLSGIKSLACIIYTGLTSHKEAKIFKDLNVKQKKPDPYKIFKANVWNGDISDPEVAVDVVIKRICDKYNIEVKKVSRGTTGKALRCLSRARQIVGSTTYDGESCFEWIIDLLNVTDWADVSNVYIREIILMLKNFWLDNRGNAELEKILIATLNKTTPTTMITKAKHDYPNYGIEPAMSLCLRDMLNESIRNSNVHVVYGTNRVA